MKIQAAALALLLAACSKPSEPAPTVTSTPATAAAPASAPTTTAAPATATDLGWDVPAKWEVAPNMSAMRKATYKIAKAAGDPEDAEMSVTQVGGGVDPNIERWVGQLKGSKDSMKRTTLKVGAFNVTVVELKGTLGSSGMPGAPLAPPKEHWALLGGIVEGIDPPYFFKMTGPEKTVAAARPEFDKLIGSLRGK